MSCNCTEEALLILGGWEGILHNSCVKSIFLFTLGDKFWSLVFIWCFSSNCFLFLFEGRNKVSPLQCIILYLNAEKALIMCKEDDLSSCRQQKYNHGLTSEL